VRDVDPEGRPTLGWQVIDHLERHFVHGPGDVQGERISLDDELAAFILRCYALDPDTGRRVHDEALLSRPKGRSKSELAGMAVCEEGTGPVRFDHWAQPGEESWWGYQFEAGDPVGRRVTYPFIRCLSTEEGQSGHTYLNVAYMLSEARDRHPDAFAGVDIGRDWQSSTRIFLPGGGEIRPSTASSAAKDGGKESFAVFDEPHLYVLAENRAMYRTVKRNLAKRRAAEPWGLLTSTMYAPGEASTCEAIHEAHAKGQTPRTLFDHKGVDYELDLSDDDALEKALRHVYGPFIEAMDLPRLMSEVRDPTADENEQRRYFLNERRAGSARWVDPQIWAQRTDATVVVADRQPITLGFDGSISRDSSALIGCTRDRHWFVVDMWERPLGPAGNGWVVPQAEVDQAVRTAMARWKVVRMYGDPREYKAWLAAWAAEFKDNKGKDIVAEFPTNSAGRFAPAVGAADVGIRNGEMSHDGDSRLARHIANAHKLYVRLRVDDGEQRPFVIQKDRPHSPRKIDGAVAGVLADAARNDALAAGLMVEEITPAPEIF
jgi:phage terminase large subunit-like protein